jgi:hypothetical protein
MAINNPQAVRFSNEKLRPLADAMLTMYRIAKSMELSWLAQGMDARLTNTSDRIIDGSVEDGRTAITGADANALRAVAAALVTAMEAAASSKLKVVDKYSVNPRGV